MGLAKIDTVCSALRNARRLELRYSGFSRVVEVHTVGENTAGNLAMNVWQVRGGSASGDRSGWKTMLFDEAFAVNEINEEYSAPRTGYARNSKKFRRIVCQV